MTKSGQKALLWIGVAAVLVISIFVVLSGSPAGGGEGEGSGGNGAGGVLASTVGNDEWTKGTGGAKVTLVEYGDFQCPACASYAPFISQIATEFGDHVEIAYRHFPLRSIHANAQLAGQASEAAGFQGQFWEMHDLLYERQGEWSNLSDPSEKFSEYAEELGLNVSNFEGDLTSREAVSGVNDDYDGGLSLGVNSTPTIFLQGERIRPSNIEEFRTLVREAVQAVQE